MIIIRVKILVVVKNLVSEGVSSKEVDEEVWGGVEDEEDVHHDDAVEEPEGQVVHALLLTGHLGLHAQRLVQAREHSGIVNVVILIRIISNPRKATLPGHVEQPEGEGRGDEDGGQVALLEIT